MGERDNASDYMKKMWGEEQQGVVGVVASGDADGERGRQKVETCRIDVGLQKTVGMHEGYDNTSSSSRVKCGGVMDECKTIISG